MWSFLFCDHYGDAVWNVERFYRAGATVDANEYIWTSKARTFLNVSTYTRIITTQGRALWECIDQQVISVH